MMNKKKVDDSFPNSDVLLMTSQSIKDVDLDEIDDLMNKADSNDKKEK